MFVFFRQCSPEKQFLCDIVKEGLVVSLNSEKRR